MSAHRPGRSRRRDRRAAPEDEEETHERWAVSYADMMTVLVGLFIVLYAISQVDQAKFEELRQSLAAGFGVAAPAVLVGGDSPLDGVPDAAIVPDLSTPTGMDTTASTGTVLTTEARTLQLAAQEYRRLEQIAEEIGSALAAQSLGDRVRFRVTDRGLVVGMVADDVFFSPASAHLTDTALRVIDTTAPVLAGLSEEISVEGHANIIPVHDVYPTNWELSADRAAKVLRRLVEAGGVAPHRIAAVGFGDARPLEEAGGVDALDANRRVDLVVLSGAPESVRSLLPSIAASEQG